MEQTRRIYTEDKAKVVAAVWGDIMYSSPGHVSCVAPGLFEEYCRMNCNEGYMK